MRVGKNDDVARKDKELHIKRNVGSRDVGGKHTWRTVRSSLLRYKYTMTASFTMLALEIHYDMGTLGELALVRR